MLKRIITSNLVELNHQLLLKVFYRLFKRILIGNLILLCELTLKSRQN